jgi:hypothetical protein
MRLNLFDVVKVGLPVLYNARLVCGKKPVVRVGIGDAANSGLVCLHNGFEVEAHAIPKGEFPTSAAGEQASTFRSPFYYVYRMFDFVQRGMEGFGGNGLSGAG